VDEQAEENFRARALTIAISRIENDTNYNSYRRGSRIRHVVQKLVKATGIDLSNGARIPELVSFQEHIREYKIVVYHSVSCEDIMFEGQVNSSKRINLDYDDVEQHYHEITNVTAATTRRYVCKGCNKSCGRDVTHACDQTCRDCMA